MSPQSGLQQNITFHIATPDHALDMVSFHNSYYNTSRKPEDWLWEYKTYNPENAVVSFAKDSDKIIATQAMLPIYMVVGKQTILSGKSESTLLLPAYRGKQVMQNLYEHAVRNCIKHGMQFIWGFTPAIKAFKKFGFDSYSGVQMMTRPGNIWVGVSLRLKDKKPIWRRIGSIAKLILNHVFIKKNSPIIHFHTKKEYELKRGICDASCLTAFYNRLRSQYNNTISIKYDQEYLRWRVREHPFIKYDEYQVYYGADLRAYAIVALVNGILKISDLTSEDIYATSLLLQTILRDYSKRAGEFCFLGNTNDILAQDLFKQLSEFCFSSIGTCNFVLRDLNGGNNREIFNIHNWHINGLWTEGYSM